MTLCVLDVPPQDVTADALGLLLDAPVPPALATLVLRDGTGGELELHVLAASHAVRATRPGHRLTEQVSCAGGRPLPRRTRRGGYAMTSTTTVESAAELAATAAELGERAEREDGWLCGAFPGHRDALTALHGAALAVAGWTWDTWHLYPGEEGGVIVRTRSRWAP